MTQATNSLEFLCVLRLSETGYSTLVSLVNSSYVAKEASFMVFVTVKLLTRGNLQGLCIMP